MNLVYIADPMCSWCYGFSVPLSALLESPSEFAPLRMRVVVGGLRPYTCEPITPGFAAELIQYWRYVANSSGQSFVQSPGTAIERPASWLPT